MRDVWDGFVVREGVKLKWEQRKEEVRRVSKAEGGKKGRQEDVI